MEAGLREVCRSVRIGKILIQRVSRGKFLSQAGASMGNRPHIRTGRGDGAGEALLRQGEQHHSSPVLN